MGSDDRDLKPIPLVLKVTRFGNVNPQAGPISRGKSGLQEVAGSLSMNGPYSIIMPFLKTVAICLLLSSTLMAEEGGAGHYMPGSMATLIDTPPTKPGWVLETIYLHYSGDAPISRSFPQAGLLTAGLEATSNAGMLGGFYTFEPLVFGAHYSLGGSSPWWTWR